MEEKELKMKFRCDCGGHLLEITLSRSKKFPMASVAIYDTYGKTRRLKKPKLVADEVRNE